MTRYFLCVVTLLLAIGAKASAYTSSWTVQSVSSSLNLSGSLSSAGTFLASVTSQAGGNGLTTNLGGNVVVHPGNLLLPPPPDIYLSGNLSASSSGSFDPLPSGAIGMQAANFGFKLDFGFLGGVNGALRNLSMQFISPQFVPSGSYPDPQSFAVDISYEIQSDGIIYRPYGIIGSTLLIPDPIDLPSTVLVPTSGTIEYSPGINTLGTATMTLPISFDQITTLSDGGTSSTADDVILTLNYTGQIVATAVVPEASSIAMLLLAGSVFGLAIRRHRRHARIGV